MRGIENALGTMSEGQKVELRLEASDAFGEKKKELVRVVPINTFRKNNMDPQPGMMFEIDGMMAHIKSVTSGRVLVDFNHPLAGEKIDYALKLDRIISKPIEKVAALMELNNVKSEATIDGKKLSLVFKEAENEQEYQMKKKLLMDGIKEFVPEIEEIDVKESFKSVKSEPKKEAAGAAGTSSAPAAKK